MPVPKSLGTVFLDDTVCIATQGTAHKNRLALAGVRRVCGGRAAAAGFSRKGGAPLFHPLLRLPLRTEPYHSGVALGGEPMRCAERRRCVRSRFFGWRAPRRARELFCRSSRGAPRSHSRGGETRAERTRGIWLLGETSLGVNLSLVYSNQCARATPR